MAKKVLITGAGGYIGSRMVESFLALGYEIIALDRFFFGDVLNDLKTYGNLKIIKDDTRFFKKEILKKVDVVVDLASLSNDTTANINPRITREINYKGPVRVATLAKEMGVKKYIFSSSCSIYGSGDEFFNEHSKLSPISEYAICKMKAEKATLKLAGKNFSVTCLRNATVFGLSKRRMRFDLIVNLMTLSAWKNNKIFILGGGKQWRPHLHIDDCIRGFLKIIVEEDLQKINRQIFNVGSDNLNFQVNQIATKFKKFFPSLIIENTPSNPDKRNYRGDFSKIERSLDFKTEKTIEDGIEEILRALKEGEVIDDIRTNTLQYYQYLIDADKILESVKIKKNLHL